MERQGESSEGREYGGDGREGVRKLTLENLKALTPQKIREILESKAYHDLVGVVETDEVEFKQEPY